MGSLETGPGSARPLNFRRPSDYIGRVTWFLDRCVDASSKRQSCRIRPAPTESVRVCQDWRFGPAAGLRRQESQANDSRSRLPSRLKMEMLNCSAEGPLYIWLFGDQSGALFQPPPESKGRVHARLMRT